MSAKRNGVTSYYQVVLEATYLSSRHRLHQHIGHVSLNDKGDLGILPGDMAVIETTSADIGPHPHIGLHTVTWLVEGELLHRDSLGSEQVIRANQLNLMTAGNGVVHSEEATGAYRGELHGLQLWVAQPDATRHGAAAFEHHSDLPRVELRNCTATVPVRVVDR